MGDLGLKMAILVSGNRERKEVKILQFYLVAQYKFVSLQMVCPMTTLFLKALFRYRPKINL